MIEPFVPDYLVSWLILRGLIEPGKRKLCCREVASGLGPGSMANFRGLRRLWQERTGVR